MRRSSLRGRPAQAVREVWAGMVLRHRLPRRGCEEPSSSLRLPTEGGVARHQHGAEGWDGCLGVVRRHPNTGDGVFLERIENLRSWLVSLRGRKLVCAGSKGARTSLAAPPHPSQGRVRRWADCRGPARCAPPADMPAMPTAAPVVRERGMYALNTRNSQKPCSPNDARSMRRGFAIPNSHAPTRLACHDPLRPPCPDHAHRRHRRCGYFVCPRCGYGVGMTWPSLATPTAGFAPRPNSPR